MLLLVTPPTTGATPLTTGASTPLPPELDVEVVAVVLILEVEVVGGVVIGDEVELELSDTVVVIVVREPGTVVVVTLTEPDTVVVETLT